MFQLRNRHLFILDILLLVVIPTLALSLRVDPPWEIHHIRGLIYFTILGLLITPLVFYGFHIYERYWRYASMDELIALTLAVMTATLLTSGIFWGTHLISVDGPRLPRSVPFINGMLTLLIVGATRFSISLSEHWQARYTKSQTKKHVLIAGAGDAGAMIVREMRNSRQITRLPAGFVDDDPAKKGVVMYGVKVLGILADIPVLARQYKVQEVIIAMPTASGEVIREVVEWCKIANVPYKTLPGINELLSGQAHIKKMRDVRIEDLLRRAPVDIDTSEVSEVISGARVLITGAGGSIGSELCRQIIRYHPLQLVVLGRGENSLFNLKNDLNWALSNSAANGGHPPPDLQIVVADIRDHRRLKIIFERYRPELVFHAAAHKHVPLMETNSEDAVTNNVFGTLNLVELAEASGVQRFVLISSDKAVNPINIMGATKRVTELIVQQAAYRCNRPFVSVRFGNVLGSRGSVIPIFQEQISKGGPVTVTHPDITRYFMTIPEAVQLVLQANTMGHKGEIFVLDMGEPIKIVDLAKDLIELSGLRVDEDIEIKFTGLRAGEKLHEELFVAGETHMRTKHEKIFVAYHYMESVARFVKQVEHLIEAARCGSPDEIRHWLKMILPTYRPAAMLE